MTNEEREEAIEVLKIADENASCDDCLYYAQIEDCPLDDDCIIRKAISVAIQALSQEPKSGWNNHQIACMLADLFGDVCACNYNGIDEWLPELCDFKDTCCPKPIGVACWEQFLKYIKSKYCECEEPCDDTVSIRKDVLKCRVGKIVAYNVEWLKKHWQMEMDIVCGVKPCDDAISRQAVLDLLEDTNNGWIINEVVQLPSVTQKSGKWIPVSERLPENTDPVNITWVNHDPESYYADIKDKPFTATGHYCNGRWWWYSVTCQDYLDEYGHWDIDAMDDAIEVTAWIPLPKPYEPQESEEQTE